MCTSQYTPPKVPCCYTHLDLVAPVRAGVLLCRCNCLSCMHISSLQLLVALLDMAPSGHRDRCFRRNAASTALNASCCSKCISNIDPEVTDVLHATAALVKGFISPMTTLKLTAALVLFG